MVMSINEALHALKGDYVVINLGPMNLNNDLNQYIPPFLNEHDLAESSVSVLNLDMGFESNFAEKPIPLDTGQEGFDFLNFKHHIGTDKPGLIQGLESIISDPNRKLILINHMSPEMPDWMIDFAKNNKAMIGNRVELIGSYFSDIPVVLYRERLFENQPDEIQSQVRNLWASWQMNFDDSLGALKQYNVFSTKELEDLRAQVAPMGVLYRNLASVPYSDLFHPDKEPEPIVGLSDEEKKILIENQIKNLDEQCPLVDAAEKGLLVTVKELAKTHNIDERNPFNRTPLMQACAKGQTEVVKFLLEQGADVTAHARDKNETPLNFAAWNHNLDIIKVLVDHQPDLLADGRGQQAIENSFGNSDIKDFIEKQLNKRKPRL